MEDNFEYLKTINNLSETVKELSIDSRKEKVNYKSIIKMLIIALVTVSVISWASVVYFIYNMYNSAYSINYNKNNITEKR